MNTFIQKYGGFFLFALGVAGILWLNLSDKNTTDTTVLITSASNYEQVVTTESSGLYFVDIKGMVHYPGVYQVSSGMRISDVVEMAGGILTEADVSGINLSKNVYDQMVIFIPEKTEEVLSSQTSEYYVDVKGNVAVPGVYPVPKGTRIYEVIALAGGFTANADSLALNLSQEVVDEMVIYVGSLSQQNLQSSFTVAISGEVMHPGEYVVYESQTLQDLITLSGGLTADANAVNLIYQMPLYAGFSISIPKVNASEEFTSSIDDGLININTADLDSLMTLNGIGIILGQRIIDYRAENGFFESIEDIMKVSGIKDSIYETIKSFITV